jgi:hypothetical protein
LPASSSSNLRALENKEQPTPQPQTRLQRGRTKERLRTSFVQKTKLVPKTTTPAPVFIPFSKKLNFTCFS